METMTEPAWVTGATVIENDEPGSQDVGINGEPMVETPVVTVDASGLTTEESAELAALESIVRAGMKVFLQVGAALLTIRDKRLYRAEYSGFDAYCREKWAFSRQRAHQLIKAVEVADSLSTMVDVSTLNERQVRALVPLPPEERRVVYDLVKATAPGGKVTANHLKSLADVVREVMHTGAIDDGTGVQVPWADATEDQKKALLQANVEEETYERYQRQREHNRRVLTSSQSAEWYTPPEIVSAAREVLGGIDLDPASCAVANATVQATTFYTEEDDGLSRVWRGTVFLNPPFERASAFMAKLIDTYTCGDVPAAIVVLSANAVSNRWFTPPSDHRLAFLGRVGFDRPDGPAVKSPFGTMVIGVGVDVDRFAAVFGTLGRVYAQV